MNRKNLTQGILAGVIGLLLVSLPANAEIVTLTTAWEIERFGAPATITKKSQILNVQPGQVARVLHFYCFQEDAETGMGFSIVPAANIDGILEVKVDGITFRYTHLTLFGRMAGDVQGVHPETGAALQPSITVVGPAEIRLNVYSDPEGVDGAMLCTIEVDGEAQIREPAEGDFTPLGMAEIAADSDGPVTVKLETSVDMKQTWQTAEPGTYGATADKRFFRLSIEN